MADTKTADFTSAASVLGTDIVYSTIDPDGTALNRRVSYDVMAAYFDGLAQTLTNKTIDADNNTISNIAIGAECTGASTDLNDTANIALLDTANAFSAAQTIDVVAQVALTVEATRNATTGLTGVLTVQYESNNDMADTFGPAINFVIKDNAPAAEAIGYIAFSRSGADNSGLFTVANYNAGVAGDAMTITPAGAVDWPKTGAHTNFVCDASGTGNSITNVEGTDIASTGEAAGTKFLGEDGDGTCSWQTPGGGGNVSNTGTPVDSQVAVWVDATTVEGDSAFTFDTSTDTLSVGTSGVVVAGTVELGHATDTTISRLGAGIIAVEGDPVPMIGSTNVFTGVNIFAGGNVLTATGGVSFTSSESALTVTEINHGITAGSDQAYEGMTLTAINSTDVGDGFGYSVKFRITDDGVTGSDIGSIGFVVDGSDTSGKFEVRVNSADTVALSVDTSGTLGIQGNTLLLDTGQSILGTVASNAITYTAPAGDAHDLVVTGTGTIVQVDATGLDVQSGTVQEGGVPISPIGVHDVWVGATAMWPSTTGGCADLAKVEIATDQDIQTLDFDGASTTAAQFEVAMPKNWNASTITVTFYWSSTAADTDDVDWNIKGVSLGDNHLLTTAYGAAATAINEAHSGAANELNITAASSALTIAGATESEFCRFLIERIGGTDTMTEDARLHGVMLHITTDAATAV